MDEVEARLPTSRFKGTKPSQRRILRVMKDGYEISMVSLTERAFTVFGRNPELSHIVLDHQSISRRHAVIFFNADESEAFVMDLGASHHTYVNAKQLDDFQPVKLSVGDIVMFGKSSRIYEFKELFSPAMPLQRPPVPLFDAQPSADAKVELKRVDAPFRDRGEERKEREREIARATAEISSIRKGVGEVDGSITLSEMAEKFGIPHGDNRQEDEDEDEDKDDDADEDEDEDQDIGPTFAQERGHDSATLAFAGGDPVASFAQTHKVPVSHQVDLGGFTKAATCVSVEPSGNRVVGGSMDSHLKLFDFGGMDARHAAFRTVVPESGHVVVALAHSPTGDRVLVATAGAQPRVFDREGKETHKFIRGDMYLRDLSNTKGHTMEVTSVAWHPSDKNLVLTGSLDGSLRMWDLAGAQSMDQLVNKTVFKLRTAPGAPQGRLAVTSCCFSFDAKKIIAGCADGSIHLWAPPVFSRPLAVLRPVFSSGAAVTCVVTCGASATAAGGVLAARGADGTALVWALNSLPNSSFQQTQSAAPIPLLRIQGLDSSHAAANVEFSPDGSLIVAGSALPVAKGQRSVLSFFKIATDGTAPTNTVAEPCLQISVMSDASVLAVKWAHATNQIFCCTSAGSIRVFYDPKLSIKGALLSAGRAAPRPREASDYASVGQIITPHALPMFRDDSYKPPGKKKTDPGAGMVPSKPPSAPSVRENASFTLTQMMASKKVRCFARLYHLIHPRPCTNSTPPAP